MAAGWLKINTSLSKNQKVTLTSPKKSLWAYKLVILIESMKRQLYKGKVHFSWVHGLHAVLSQTGMH